MLMNQTKKNKNYSAGGINWNGKWDISVSGSATSGDNSWQAASRELKEEIGLDYNFEKHNPVLLLIEVMGLLIVTF